MCGRVRLSSDYSEIKIKLKFDLSAPAPNFEADWNKPPTAPMLVAIRSEDGKRVPRGAQLAAPAVEAAGSGCLRAIPIEVLTRLELT